MEVIISAYVETIRDRLMDADGMAEHARLAPHSARSQRGEASSSGSARRAGDGRRGHFQFDDAGAARRWYCSAQYQKLLPYRLRGAEHRVVLVDGIPAAG